MDNGTMTLETMKKDLEAAASQEGTSFRMRSRSFVYAKKMATHICEFKPEKIINPTYTREEVTATDAAMLWSFHRCTIRIQGSFCEPDVNNILRLIVEYNDLWNYDTMVYAIEKVARDSHQHHKILTPMSDVMSHSGLQKSILTFVCPVPSESGIVWQTYQIEIHATIEFGHRFTIAYLRRRVSLLQNVLPHVSAVEPRR